MEGFAISPFDWILGLGIMFGVSFLLTMLIEERNMLVFLTFATMMGAFVVWAGLLELWVLIACIVGLSVMIMLEFRGKVGSE